MRVVCACVWTRPVFYLYPLAPSQPTAGVIDDVSDKSGGTRNNKVNLHQSRNWEVAGLNLKGITCDDRIAGTE